MKPSPCQLTVLEVPRPEVYRRQLLRLNVEDGGKVSQPRIAAADVVDLDEIR